MSTEHIRASLTVAELAPAAAAYQAAQADVFNARVKLADLPHESSRRAAQAALVRSLETLADAAHEEAVAKLVHRKAAEAVAGASAAAA